MRIQQQSEQTWVGRRFLESLNGNEKFIPDLVDMEEVPKPISYFWPPRDNAFHREVLQAYVINLRRFADAWIATGRDEHQVETPRDRNLRSFDQKCFRDLEKFRIENPPKIGFEESGKTKLFPPQIKYARRSPLALAKDEAIQVFCRFLDTPYRSQLFKCRSCEIYYYSKRQPRGPIKNGTYCDKHRHVASAKRSNERKRGPERSRKLELAAQYWGRWPKRLVDEGLRSEWVADKVNQGLRGRYAPIKRNWITRNRAAIESKAERATNATS